MTQGGLPAGRGWEQPRAVGIPGSLLRFAMLQCYDQVRAHRLPEGLGDENPRGTWRCIDGAWTQGPVPAKDA